MNMIKAMEFTHSERRWLSGREVILPRGRLSLGLDYNFYLDDIKQMEVTNRHCPPKKGQKKFPNSGHWAGKGKI